MRIHIIVCLLLIVIGIMTAGCTTNPSAGEGAPLNQTPATLPTPSAQPTENISVTPTLATGDHYLQNSYSFDNQSEPTTETVRIADPSWAISYTILPLSDNPKNCWFTLTVTNLDTMKNQTFTWTYINETFQQYPMYTTGPYQFTMTGNLVNVKLDVAKRLP